MMARNTTHCAPRLWINLIGFEMSATRRTLISWIFANIIFVYGIFQMFSGDTPLLQAQIDSAFYVVMGIAWLLCSVLMWFAIKDHYKKRGFK
jgi:hypothetical protein